MDTLYEDGTLYQQLTQVEEEYFKATPIHYAITKENTELRKLILEYAEKVHKLILSLLNKRLLDAYGNNPLHTAVITGNPEIIDILIDAGANPNIPNPEKETPLHIAVKVRNSQVIEHLVERGADPSILDRNELPAIWYAVPDPRYNENTLALLIPKFKKEKKEKRFLNKIYTPETPSNTNKEETLLHRAAYYKNNEAIIALVSAGADITIEDREGYVPLWRALEQFRFRDKRITNITIIERLLPEKENARSKILNRKYGPEEETPLILAVKRKAYPIIPFLVEKGADVTISDRRGLPPLWHLIEIMPPRFDQYIIEIQENYPEHTANGMPRLHPTDIINSLIPQGKRKAWSWKGGKKYRQKKAFLDHLYGGNKETLLHHAVNHELKDVVQALLQADANPLIEDRSGQIPLDLAHTNGYTEIAELLDRHINRR